MEHKAFSPARKIETKRLPDSYGRLGVVIPEATGSLLFAETHSNINGSC